MSTAELKWSQWTPSEGMIRCGRADYQTIMKWMVDLGKEAKKCLSAQEKEHAIYGMKIYDENDNLAEVRFYANTYMNDDELAETTNKMPRNIFYVAHKM